ncbi:MAG: hypothetical protein RL308_2147 [Bacteroidota bacterium]|jgi:hypothetical protein
MKKILALVLFFMAFSMYAQQESEERQHYSQFDIATSLKGNSNYGEIDSNGVRSDYWFLPDGLSVKYGIGIHHEKWVALGIHTGIDWLGTDKLVIVPVFANLRVCPKIGKESRVYLQAGFGKSFGIGRGSLIGEFRKISLGIENDEGLSLFIQISSFGIPFKNLDSAASLSIGLSLFTF